MASLLLLNGPNLNLLGRREPEIYGAQTLADIEQGLTEMAEAAGHTLECFQSNSEGAIIDCIHETDAALAICNLGAYTHTSIAIRDALLGAELDVIEVHISNVHARESFRAHSHIADIALGSIVGLGTLGYALALQAALHALEDDE